MTFLRNTITNMKTEKYWTDGSEPLAVIFINED
jgi:hypothetical protein